MRTKITVERADGSSVDVVVTTDSRASVGDVAAALHRCDPVRAGEMRAADTSAATLVVTDGGRRQVVQPEVPFSESPVFGGCVVTVVPAPASGAASTTGGPLATLVVVSGPDQGLRVQLTAQSTLIGRSAGADVQLADPMVSKRHARVVVTDLVHVVDLNSANGILLDGELVRRVELGPDDVFVLGDTGIRVTPVTTAWTGSALSAGAGPSAPFNRGPHLDVRFDGETLAAPEPPESPRRRPFPLISLLVPVAMGATLLLVTRSVYAVAFVAMSPLLFLGAWLEDRITTTREHRAATVAYQDALAVLRGRIAEATQAERAARSREHPSSRDVVSAVLGREPSMWSRRPASPRWLELRVGTGARPARTEVLLPRRTSAPQALWQQLEQAVAGAGDIEPVPVVLALPTSGAVGVAGRRDAVRGVVNGLLAQLVGLHSPAEVVLALLTDRSGAQRWSWLRWLPHTSSEHSPLRGSHLAPDDASGRAMLTALEAVIADRSNTGPQVGTPAMVVLVEDAAVTQRPRLAWIAEHGAAVGVHVIHVAERPEDCWGSWVLTSRSTPTAGGPWRTAVSASWWTRFGWNR